VEALGINGGFLIAQLVNFGVIILLLGLLAWRPLTRMLDERAMKIARQLEDAEVAAKARANAEAEAATIMEEARRQAAALTEEGRGRSDETIRSMIAEARAEAEKILADARQRVEEERNRQLADLRDQVIGLAIAATHKLVGEALDEKRQRELVNQFFSTAPEGARGLGGRVEVVSALPLTDAEQAEIKRQTGAGVIVFRVDPSIMGGLVIRAGDRVIDGSVRASLRDLVVHLN
jgi:F-type H+-transporting ATPase subunit b